MIDFSNSSFVTPERVVILGIFCVGVPCGGKDLVPESGINVRFRNAMRRLTVKQNIGMSSTPKFLLVPPPTR